MNEFFLNSYEVVGNGWGTILYWSSSEKDFLDHKTTKVFNTDSLDCAESELETALTAWKDRNTDWIGIINVGIRVIKNKLIQENDGSVTFIGEVGSSFKWKLPPAKVSI